MKIQCLSCNRDINVEHQGFRTFKGSLKCVYCNRMMEIQMLGGILIWGYPVQGVDHDHSGGTPETSLYGEQKKM